MPDVFAAITHEEVLISDVRVIPARASWQPIRGTK
jgi:hypothetical protein